MEQIRLPLLILSYGSFRTDSFADFAALTEAIIELDLFFDLRYLHRRLAVACAVYLVFDYCPAAGVVSATPYFFFKKGKPVWG